MTSPSSYMSTLRFDFTGNPGGGHLSDAHNDVTGNSVTSSRNSRSLERAVLRSPRGSTGQNQAVAYLRLSTGGQTDGVINGRETVSPPGESNHNCQRYVTAKPSRAVSVPASVHRGLDLDFSSSPRREGEGHRSSYSTDVRVTLVHPRGK